jgi:type IV secretory pathway TraG/TraD family ATPase VirD4
MDSPNRFGGRFTYAAEALRRETPLLDGRAGRGDPERDVTVWGVSSSVPGPPRVPGAPGGPPSVVFPDAALSLHVLMLGAPGTGKTNAMHAFLSELLRTGSPSDRIVVFDTKGDYLRTFFDPRFDMSVGLTKLAPARPDHTQGPNQAVWNMFEDILVDEPSDQDITAGEISRTLYDEAVRQSNQPFFPKAAQAVTRAAMLALLRETLPKGPTNESLLGILRDPARLMELTGKYPDLSFVKTFIGTEGSERRGILSEIELLCNYILIGTFARRGAFSIRRFVRGNYAQHPVPQILFLEYDVATASSVQPVFRVLMDLAIKESLSRSVRTGRVFFLIDELALLPNLYYLDYGINFGRELGARFLVGTQNVPQVVEQYHAGRALSILASFGTIVAFRLSDSESRRIVSERNGPSEMVMKIPGFTSADQGHRQVLTLPAVDEHELSTLPNLEAIVQYPEFDPREPAAQPFRLRFRYVRSSVGHERGVRAPAPAVPGAPSSPAKGLEASSAPVPTGGRPG